MSDTTSNGSARRRSAGVVVWRRRPGRGVEVLLGHMGGPYWQRKDEGAWTIPKGEVEPGDDELATARREFEEETGLAVPPGDLVDLGEVRQAGGKTVRAWAVEGEVDASAIRSNTFEIEWPPRSGRMQTFPEIDRAGWFDLDTARRKVVRGQVALLDRLLNSAARSSP